MKGIEREQSMERIGRKRRAYRRFLYSFLFLSCISLFGVWYLSMYQQFPGNIKLRIGEEQVLHIGMPVVGEITKIDRDIETGQAVTANGQGKANVAAGSMHVDFNNAVTMKANTLSNYRMDLKIFGFIPFKQVDIQVIRDMQLTPVGLPIGIYLKAQGVLVIGIGDFLSLDGTSVSPSRYLLKTGDYIVAVDHNKVDGKKEFINIIEKSDGNPLVLTVNRDGEEFDVSITPRLNQNGLPKLGIWVRDNAQGVGTMTFVDSEGNFGALGHGINDIDTSIVLNLDSGTLYSTEIIGIKKGSRGDPGEMTGMIDYGSRNILGIVEENTDSGIFGTCNDKMISLIDAEPMPIALKQEVSLGEAQIICTVDGKPRYYDIRIKELRLEHDNVNKGIVLQVTDPELISITGGIIQGMSGAPIIQNGKIIGAVTHVLVNDSTSGYGIFIENMIEH